jgi:uncharacterized protein YecE (DUF72 family)
MPLITEYGTRQKKWAEKTKNKDFLFCPKMYKGVTHFGSLKGKDFISNEFLRGVMAFEKHLGPIFVQVSDSFSPKRKEELFIFMHMHDEATSPELTVYLVDKMNAACGLNLLKPKFIDAATVPKLKQKQKGLFD